MHPVQIAVLVALFGYIGYRIRRDNRAQREFFRTLIPQLTTVLATKGIRLAWSTDLSGSIGGRIATFEAPTFSLEVFFDLRDRDVLLLQRETGVPRATGQTIASASLPHFAKPDTLKRAAAVVVDAAARSNDNAYLKPARFKVRDVFELTDRGRAISGTILAGRFRVGARVWVEHAPSFSFTISDVGFADDIAKKQAWITFVSEDAPPLTQLREVLSSGSILTDAEPVAEAIVNSTTA